MHDLYYPEGKSVNDGIAKMFTHVEYESIDNVVTIVKSSVAAR